MAVFRRSCEAEERDGAREEAGLDIPELPAVDSEGWLTCPATMMLLKPMLGSARMSSVLVDSIECSRSPVLPRRSRLRTLRMILFAPSSMPTRLDPEPVSTDRGIFGKVEKDGGLLLARLDMSACLTVRTESAVDAVEIARSRARGLRNALLSRSN